jgi:hypothetical protein
VGAVSVVGNGAILCDGGTYGTLVAYDAGGAELSRIDLHLTDPSDCSPPSNPDNVTYGATGTLYATQVIAKAVILPMTPLTFLVGTDTGHASATYTVYYGRTPRLMIVASTTSATVGDTVWYGAQVSSIGGTISVSSWRWDADAGYVPPPGAVERLSAAQCGANTGCGHTPLVPGVMWVFGTVNGNPDSASIHVNAIACPTKDTILDNPIIRRGLLQALSLSKADSVPTSIRREQGGYIYRDTTTGQLAYQITTAAGGDACNVNFTADLAHTIYMFHTHPFNPSEGLSGPEKLPSTNCLGTAAGSWYDPKTWGGLSPFDWRLSVNKGKPSVVIDRKRIYVSDPSVTDSTRWGSSTRRYDWNTGKCKW